MRRGQIHNEQDVLERLTDKTDFERAVLAATYRIPKGMVSTYSRIAAKIGRPRSMRAVANALHKNPLHPIVPCHRVVKSDGGFGGPKKGADSRRKQVRAEGVPMKDGKVVITEDILF